MILVVELGPGISGPWIQV